MGRLSNFDRDEILLLFDMDGTLTFPRTIIEPEIEAFIYDEIQPRATIGIVGTSDLDKMFEQLNGKKILQKFDFIFPENGVVQIENGVEIGSESITRHLGEETLQRFINFCLNYLSQVTLPFKRGTFIEFRHGMLNICPMGRQCSKEERNIFSDYDRDHHVRAEMIEKLKNVFADVDLTYTVGGVISFEVFPHGWDKTFCLRHIEKYHKYSEIHFFGDRTEPGGNDYELYNDSRVIGHRVETPYDTKRILCELFEL